MKKKIVNARLEPGNYTSFNTIKNNRASSVVDYLITNHVNFAVISFMNIIDLTEFSDHCPIEFALNYEQSVLYHSDVLTYDKIFWEDSDPSLLLDSLDKNKHLFDDLSNKLISNEIDIDTFVDDFSCIVYDISFKLHCKSCRNGPRLPKCRKSEWFDKDCKKSKTVFLESKRVFRSVRSDENRKVFLENRKAFCKIKRNAKHKYYISEKCKMSKLSKKNPRKFWKYINKFKKKLSETADGLSLNDFVDHFKNISNTTQGHYVPNDNSSARSDPLLIDELDKPFTIFEIAKTLRSLQRHKSSDFSNNVADFFIESSDFISPYLTTIFNKIFETGIYPEAWCKGVIVPIHKKGDTLNASNYRGITLINVMAKIFSLLLRNRLNKWCENNEVFSDAQFGFRDNRSTTDCVFLLHSIIQNILNKKCKLYCAFIDFQMAFDTVIRDALWVKLLDTEISCKMINILKSIYSKVKSCVKLTAGTNFSEFFDVTLGLKQGEPLSPILFILFINDINNNIDINHLSENDLNFL